jgi:hypothetical protein
VNSEDAGLTPAPIQPPATTTTAKPTVPLDPEVQKIVDGVNVVTDAIGDSVNVATNAFSNIFGSFASILSNFSKKKA